MANEIMWQDIQADELITAGNSFSHMAMALSGEEQDFDDEEL